MKDLLRRAASSLADRTHALCCAAAAFLATSLTQALFVRLFGSPTPFWDEWVLLQLFADYRAGELTWLDLFAQHNEHRIFVGRAIFLATFSLLGEWDPLSNMLVSALLVGCVAAVLVYALIRLRLPAACALVACVILVSPTQSENMLWGFQVPYYTLLLAFIGSVALLALCRRVSLPVVGLLLAAGFVYTFSLAIGLVLWGVVGICLALRLAADHAPPQSALRDRRAWALLGVFALGALTHIGFYLHGLQLGDGGDVRPKSVAALLRWAAMALGFPFFGTTDHSSAALALAAAVIWAPITAALALRARQLARGDAGVVGRLVLLVGIALFALSSVALTSYGRAGLSYVPSRYTTLYQWSSMACCVALADLFAQARGLRRWRLIGRLALAALGALVLLGTLSRAAEGARSIAQQPFFRAADTRILASYLSDPLPDRHIVGPLGVWSNAYLEERLSQQRFRDLLPLTVRAPAQQFVPVQQEGDAWAPALPLSTQLARLDTLSRPLVADDWAMGGGVPLAAVPLKEPIGWGSWRGGAGHTGRITVGPFRVVAPTLLVPVIGRAASAGNTLLIEAADDPQQRVVFGGGNPPAYWAPWRADVTPLVGRDVRIVAVDDSTDPDAWFGFGWPTPETRGSRLVDRLLRGVDRASAPGAVACVVLLMAGASYERWRGSAAD